MLPSADARVRFEHTHKGTAPSAPILMTFRILGPHERGRFAPEAWGQLLALAQSGAVTPSELEALIERALVQIDGRIALEDLRALVEGAGIAPPPNEGRETVH